MRLDTLTIKGVLAFDEERTLPFRDLPAGLIAIVGPNGVGKTAIIESPIATLFRIFPSREKKKPFDYATRSDAFLQQTFELEGRGLYRARLNLDPVRRTQQAVLLRTEPDGREVFVSDKESLESYDAAITALLPPLDDLLASAVAVQTNRGSFSERDKKGKRDLLYSLIGLDRWEVKAARAREAVARVQRETDRLQIQHTTLAREVGGDAVDAELSRRAQLLQTAIGDVEVRRVEVRRLMTAAEDALAALEADARSYAAAAARHERHQADLTARRTERTHVETTLERTRREGTAERARLIARYADWQQRNLDAQFDTTDYTSEVDRLNVALEDAVSSATRKIAENTRLITDDATIRAAAAELVDLDTERAAQEAVAKEALLALDAAASADQILTASLTRIERTEAELRRADADAALLTKVPCHGDAAFAACQFLTNAQQAKKTIARLTEAIAMKATLLDEQRGAHARRDLARAQHTVARDKITVLDRRRAKIQPDAEKLPYVVAAKTRIGALEQQIADLRHRYGADLQAAVTRSGVQVAKLKAEAEHAALEHQGQLTVFDQSHTERLTALEAQVDRLGLAIAEAGWEVDRDADVMAATADAAEHATTEQARLSTYRAEWDETTARLATARAQLAELDADRARVATRRGELAVLTGRLTQLEADGLEWSVLAKGCGRDGVPTLEIDAWGPRLTALFNDLLQTTYGGRFTGELVTQARKVTPGRDGSEYKEVVEFKIYDQQRGGAERDLTDLSGGQKVVVEEALRSAIALLVNSRTPFPIRTCFRDEPTGSLDRDSAVRYVAMLRRVMEIGGFYQLLFVSHLDDCKALADAQIVIDRGDFTFRYPPYGPTLDPAADAIVDFTEAA